MALSCKGFGAIYARLGVSFEEVTGQSHFSERGKRLCAAALERGRAKRQDGAVVYSLGGIGLPDKVILRSDGTAMYQRKTSARL